MTQLYLQLHLRVALTMPYILGVNYNIAISDLFTPLRFHKTLLFRLGTKYKIYMQTRLCIPSKNQYQSIDEAKNDPIYWKIVEGNGEHQMEDNPAYVESTVKIIQIMWRALDMM